MISKEILKQVKLLEISTRKMVNNLFAGEYHTVFKGQGLTFADFREYVPGDDVRAISWNLTAKTGKPFVKRYEEERELTMVLAVDISGSELFGSGDYLKGEVLVNMAAVLAFAAQKNGDKVGLMLFTDHVEHYVPPKKGRGHVNRILRDLLYFKPKSEKTNIKSAIDELSHTVKKRATVFILSDFLNEGFDRSLRLLSKKHDVVAVIIEDRAEKNIPSMGLVDFEDAETGEIISVDTSSPFFQSHYKTEYSQLVSRRSELLKKSQVDTVFVDTSKDFLDPLIKFFSGRHRK